jgi:hypothetical protein
VGVAAGRVNSGRPDEWRGVVTAAGFKAQPGTWAAAGHEVADASQSLAAVTSRLCLALAESWGAWGNDNIGESFCNGASGKPGFGRAADNLLTALAQMVNLLEQTGRGLELTGARYAAADTASTLGAPQPGPLQAPRPAVYKLPTVSRMLVPSDPAPPEWEFLLQLLARMVAGCEYPVGNFGALGVIVTELSTAGNAISGLADTVRRAATSVTSHNAGSATDQFGSFAKNLVSGLEWLAAQCTALSSSTDNLLRQKKAARIEFWASLAFLAVMFAAAQALAFFSFGASEGGFLAAVVGQGVGLRAMLLFALRMVIEGIAFSAGEDAIDQFARIHEGLQHGFNEDEFWVSVGTGAVASLITLGLGSALHAGAGVSGTLATVTGWMEHDASASLAAKAGGVVTRMAVNGLNGTVANIAGQAIFDDGHVNLAQAAEGGFGMAVLGEGTELGNRMMLRSAAARAAGSGGDPAATVDVPSAISDPRPPGGRVQAALNTDVSSAISDPRSAAGGVQAGGRVQAALNGDVPGSRAGGTDDVTLAGTGQAAPAGPHSEAPALSVSAATPSGAGHAALTDVGQGADGRPEAVPATDITARAGVADAVAPAVTHLTASPEPTKMQADGTSVDGVTGHPNGVDGGSSGGDGQAAAPDRGIAAMARPADSAMAATPRADGSPALHSPGSAGGSAADPVRPMTSGEEGQRLVAPSVPQATAEPQAVIPGTRAAANDAGDASYVAEPGYTPEIRYALDPRYAQDPRYTAQAGYAADAADGSGALAFSHSGAATDAGRPDGFGQSADTGSAYGARYPTRADNGAHPADNGDHAPAGGSGHAASAGRGDAAAGDRAVPAPGADHAGLPGQHQEPAVFVNGDHPNLPRNHPAVKWGEATDVYGKPLPVWNDKQTAEDFGQGALGNCVNIAIGRELLRMQNGELGERFLRDLTPAAAKSDSWTMKEVIGENPDGSVTVRFHETNIGRDGVAEPTGRMIEMRMEKDLPTSTRNPGRTVYTNARRASALYTGLLEKGTAAVDRSWSEDRAAMDAEQYPEKADLRGFARIQGNNRWRAAELLSQLTGEPAHSMTFQNAEDAVATWKQLTDAGTPVIGATRSQLGFADDGNPYHFVTGHAYGIIGVVHGTLDDARAAAARLHGETFVPRTETDNPGDPGAVDDYVIADNPWGTYQPEPVPVKDVSKVFALSYGATLGLPDYLRNMDVTVGQPDLRPDEAGHAVFAEPRSETGAAIPFRDGIPDASQVIPGKHDIAAMETIRAVTRTHPELIDAAIKQNADGSFTMQVHEANIYQDFQDIRATGRVFTLNIKQGLPVDPDTGRPLYADVSAGGATWPGYMEKGLAGIDQRWSSDRNVRNYALNPDAPDARGFARIGEKFKLYESAEFLTQITGRDAQVLAKPTADEAVQAWQQLIDEGKPVLVQPKVAGEGPYKLLGDRIYELEAIKDGYVILTGSQTPDPIPVSEVGNALQNTVATLK